LNHEEHNSKFLFALKPDGSRASYSAIATRIHLQKRRKKRRAAKKQSTVAVNRYDSSTSEDEWELPTHLHVKRPRLTAATTME
jgi:hypothetical protein